MPKTINALIPRMGNVRINFLGHSELLFNNYIRLHEFERQKRIPHLGIINKRRAQGDGQGFISLH